jgi:hypothetical protein
VPLLSGAVAVVLALTRAPERRPAG